MNHLKLITNESLDLDSIKHLLDNGESEATAVYVGKSINNVEEKKIARILYETNEQMALTEMQNICSDLRNKFSNIINILIYHRLGEVLIDKYSIVIAISSNQHETAFNSIAYAIDEFKRRISIRKMIFYEEEDTVLNGQIRERIKRKKFDVKMCQVDKTGANFISNNLVQIPAQDSEINHRIDNFIKRKRAEIDMNNIFDYSSKYPEGNQDTRDSEFTCARINSTIVKQENSKCHLKVKRVRNASGPQTDYEYKKTLDRLMSQTTQPNDYKKANSLIEERLVSVTNFLRLSNIDKGNILERLKSIEDRILYMESISPEYVKLTTNKNFENATNSKQSYNKTTYNTSDLEALIEQKQLLYDIKTKRLN